MKKPLWYTGKEKDLLELMTLIGHTDTYEHETDGNKVHDLNVFSFACITAATNSFSSENKLGEGGFGPVYKVHVRRNVVLVEYLLLLCQLLGFTYIHLLTQIFFFLLPFFNLINLLHMY